MKNREGLRSIGRCLEIGEDIRYDLNKALMELRTFHNLVADKLTIDETKMIADIQKLLYGLEYATKETYIPKLCRITKLIACLHEEEGLRGGGKLYNEFKNNV